MKIKFCGATIGVTGSCHLLTTDRHRVLLDCGQFQGNKEMDDITPLDIKEVYNVEFMDKSDSYIKDKIK